MARSTVLVLAWLPDGMFAKLAARMPQFEWLDGREPAAFEQHHERAEVTYGMPPVARIADMKALRWIQLISAGVPQDLCPVAQTHKLTVTNLAGLYGPTIAEHALAFVSVLRRNLHTAFLNQQKKSWDRTVADRLGDLHGKTVAIVGLGNIGTHVARLARAYGMRIVGCRRTDAATPEVDQIYPCAKIKEMLAEADFVVVAAPLVKGTEGMLGPAEFAAMKPGVIYVNVSRGPVAQEAALLEALKNGKVAAAGLDVFATEPLPADHPFWTMPQVLISPHYCGETVNMSSQPAERFARNLAAWSTGRPLEGTVDLACGY